MGDKRGKQPLGWSEQCNRVFPHAFQIPAAKAATLSGAVAMACCVTVATTAAVTAEARGGVPFAERSAALIAAGEQVGGGAALHTGEGFTAGQQAFILKILKADSVIVKCGWRLKGGECAGMVYLSDMHL